MVESRAPHTWGSWLYGLDSWYQFHVVELGALAALLAVPLGAVRGFLVTLAVAAVAATAYLGVLRPRLVRWGATDEEVARPMPGDDIAAPGGRRTTRAVTIGVPAVQVWPWLAQLGYGRAGWYSDHLPGTGRRRGTAQIRPEWQQLGPGDRILVMPDSGFDVVAVEDRHYFVARTADGAMSWCVQVEPLDQHSCRLLSRWHARWFVIVTSARWTALSDPSSFAAERRMLLGIKERAEHARPAGTHPSPLSLTTAYSCY